MSEENVELVRRAWQAVNERDGHLFGFRGDRVVRIEWFLDPEEAFKRLDEEG